MAKMPIYIRIDEETLAWFRKYQGPKGYQTRINDVLRGFRIKRQRQVDTLAGRAQEIYRRFHARCFWHLDRDLRITPETLPLVREGLRKYGGREGFLLAEELELDPFGENSHAD